MNTKKVESVAAARSKLSSQEVKQALTNMGALMRKEEEFSFDIAKIAFTDANDVPVSREAVNQFMPIAKHRVGKVLDAIPIGQSFSVAGIKNEVFGNELAAADKIQRRDINRAVWAIVYRQILSGAVVKTQRKAVYQKFDAVAHAAKLAALTAEAKASAKADEEAEAEAKAKVEKVKVKKVKKSRKVSK